MAFGLKFEELTSASLQTNNSARPLYLSFETFSKSVAQFSTAVEHLEKKRVGIWVLYPNIISPDHRTENFSMQTSYNSTGGF